MITKAQAAADYIRAEVTGSGCAPPKRARRLAVKPELVNVRSSTKQGTVLLNDDHQVEVLRKVVARRADEVLRTTSAKKAKDEKKIAEQARPSELQRVCPDWDDEYKKCSRVKLFLSGKEGGSLADARAAVEKRRTKNVKSQALSISTAPPHAIASGSVFGFRNTPSPRAATASVEPTRASNSSKEKEEEEEVVPENLVSIL